MPVNKGFTLIELVLVILLLGILATFAVPRWLGKGGVEIQTVRDELLTRLRWVQTLNMHEPPHRCTQLVIDVARVAHITSEMKGLECPPPAAIADWNEQQRTRGRLVSLSDGITLSVPQGGPSPMVIRFDRMGRPVGHCNGGCELLVTGGPVSGRIKIEAQGYIHEIP
ncbi:prepilin-type N-terminal cleavage/methylation domain-containing protein [Aeromonas cavernicola]|uniref:MSHA biogenesis protein MshC n=1 Tax=Aeromonas cavernicola TaxID=1006623 RepID=A0A2H9U2G4_9GAMM|nr:prepilin-type N-terminal cleavage/methylation domain-containing protein [Aeromonas cavernicola]PJG58159.1 MSHA biogenesis protein MshC [Aeromonas cavernicola]